MFIAHSRILALGLILLLVSCIQKKEPVTDAESSDKTYYVGLIKRGPVWSPEVTDEVNRLQEEHMASINRLADSGLLVLAGPFWDETGEFELRGLFFFDVETIEQARSLCETDPAVKAGRLQVDVYPWTAPPLLSYNEPVEMTTYISVMMEKGPSWSIEQSPSHESLTDYANEQLLDSTVSVKLVTSGPFDLSYDANRYTAMMIFEADSLAQVRDLVSLAPGMESGVVVPTVVPWYGPVGLRLDNKQANEQAE